MLNMCKRWYVLNTTNIELWKHTEVYFHSSIFLLSFDCLHPFSLEVACWLISHTDVFLCVNLFLSCLNISFLNPYLLPPPTSLSFSGVCLENITRCNEISARKSRQTFVAAGGYIRSFGRRGGPSLKNYSSRIPHFIRISANSFARFLITSLFLHIAPSFLSLSALHAYEM